MPFSLGIFSSIFIASFLSSTAQKTDADQMRIRSRIATYTRREFQAIDDYRQLVTAPLEPGMQFRAVTKTWFNALSVVKALAAKYEVTELTIAIYRMNEASAKSIVDIAKQGEIDVFLLLNRWFKTPRNYQRWCQWLCDAEPAIQGLHIGFESCHVKIALIGTACGKHIVFEGSGNLSDNDRIEQYLIEDNIDAFDFHREWIHAAIAANSSAQEMERDG